jgi:hypothetical protein
VTKRLSKNEKQNVIQGLRRLSADYKNAAIADAGIGYPTAELESWSAESERLANRLMEVWRET